MNTHVTACVQSVHHQHAHMTSDGHATGQLQHGWCPGQSQTICIKRFRRSPMWQIFVSHTHCCITPQISKFKAHMMTLVHSDEAMIHLMQFSLVISHCKITSSVFWLSQDNVATLIRWGGWSSYCHMCHSFLWPSYGIGQAIIFLPCGFFFSSFFPHLISAAADWMSSILLHMVWPQCEFRMQIWNVLHAARWKCRT